MQFAAPGPRLLSSAIKTPVRADAQPPSLHCIYRTQASQSMPFHAAGAQGPGARNARRPCSHCVIRGVVECGPVRPGTVREWAGDLPDYHSRLFCKRRVGAFWEICERWWRDGRMVESRVWDGVHYPYNGVHTKSRVRGWGVKRYGAILFILSYLLAQTSDRSYGAYENAVLRTPIALNDIEDAQASSARRTARQPAA